jgi:hypothetical protein
LPIFKPCLFPASTTLVQKISIIAFIPSHVPHISIIQHLLLRYPVNQI